MKPKISQTSKMKITGKRVASWSLPAGASCPGSSDAEVCKSCYAKKGMYRFPTVKNVREFNQQDYKADDWVERMTNEVNKYDYFRWFDSGDLETPLLASKIHDVITATPNTSHWLPSRSDKIRSIATQLTRMQGLSNAAIRPSADNIGLDKQERVGVNSYVINVSDIPKAIALGINVCPVTLPGSTQKSCDTCTMCYTTAKVAYVIH